METKTGTDMTEVKWTKSKESFKPVVDVVNSKIKRVEINVQEEIDKFPLQVYGERIFVVEEVITEYSGIFMPESYQKGGEMQTNIGYIVACGPDVVMVKPGDRIFYGRYSGAWVMDKRYRVLNEEDIFGKFKDNSMDFIISGADSFNE